MPVINMVDGSDNCRIISMAQMIDIQCVADLLYAVLNIQAGSAVGICLISDGKLDLIRDVFDKSGWIVMDGSFHSSAPRVTEDQHCIAFHSGIPVIQHSDPAGISSGILSRMLFKILVRILILTRKHFLGCLCCLCRLYRLHELNRK